MLQLQTGLLVGGLCAVGVAISPLVSAVQLADGTRAFNHPPQLIKSAATFSSAGSTAAIYSFTLTVPADAGEPLQKVSFQQAEGSEPVQFRLKDTTAYVGERLAGQELPVVASVQEQGAIVTFDPPIAPGATVTIALRPTRNPDFPGIYQFGVTAFPEGEKVQGQFLGFGRFAIRRRRGV